MIFYVIPHVFWVIFCSTLIDRGLVKTAGVELKMTGHTTCKFFFDLLSSLKSFYFDLSSLKSFYIPQIENFSSLNTHKIIQTTHKKGK